MVLVKLCSIFWPCACPLMHNWVTEAQILSQHEVPCSATTKKIHGSSGVTQQSLCPVFAERPFQSVGDYESNSRNQSNVSAWSLETLNWACGASRTNREMQGITEVWILSASCRDKCSGWVLIGTSITCAVMQRQLSRPAAPESCAQAHLCGSACKPPLSQHSPHPPAGAMLCSPPSAPEVFLLDNF